MKLAVGDTHISTFCVFVCWRQRGVNIGGQRHSRVNLGAMFMLTLELQVVQTEISPQGACLGQVKAEDAKTYWTSKMDPKKR